jgi:hypothetical protein
MGKDSLFTDGALLQIELNVYFYTNLPDTRFRWHFMY